MKTVNSWRQVIMETSSHLQTMEPLGIIELLGKQLLFLTVPLQITLSCWLVRLLQSLHLQTMESLGIIELLQEQLLCMESPTGTMSLWQSGRLEQ